MVNARRFVIAVCVSAASLGCASLKAQPATQGTTPALDEIVQRSLDAIGGRATLRDLRNLHIRAEWTEAGTSFAGVYRATREGLMRIDVFVDGKRVFSEGVDAGGGWEQRGEGEPVTPIADALTNTLARGAEYRFHGIWAARERGHEVSLAGEEFVDGHRYFVVRLRMKDGFETFFYVNASTWLIERQRDVRAYHPSNDATKTTLETVHEAFQQACGVTIPARSRDVDLGKNQVLTRQTVTAVRCNVPFPELELDRPAKPTASGSSGTEVRR